MLIVYLYSKRPINMRVAVQLTVAELILSKCRHDNHPDFGGILPLSRHTLTIPRRIYQIILFAE